MQINQLNLNTLKQLNTMKKILFASLVMGSIFSCSDDDSNGNGENNPDTILPIKIVSTYNEGKYSSTATLTYDGNKLKEISTVYPQENNYVERTVFQYDGDYISKFTSYDGNKEDLIKEFTYKNGKITTSKTTEWDNTGTKYVSTSTYQCVNNDHLIEKTTYNDSSSQTYEYYYTNGNLTKKTGYSNGYYSTTYDVYNNPYINIKGIKEISIDEEVTFSKNNPITISQISDLSSNGTYQYTYEYNDKKFPTKSTEIYKDSNTNDTDVINYYYNK